jgi:signal peptidase
VRAAEPNCKMKSKTAKSIIKDIVIVAVGVAAIWIGLQIAFGTQNPFYVVSSGSMIPVLEVYDVLVVDGKVPFENIQMGDIIVFNRPNGHDRVIVHRVVAVLDEDPKTVRTKGDANPVSIPGTDYPITDDEYIGKVAYVIPQVGYVTRILAPPINYIIIAVIIGIMIVKQYAGKPKRPKFGDQEKEMEKTEFEKTTDEEYSKERIPDAKLDGLEADTVQDDKMGADPGRTEDVGKTPDDERKE